ncbi:recombinase XerD [Calidifontibacter terrae]
MPIEVKPRNTTRGRPRTTGTTACARCQRLAGKARTTWPDGRICGTCFYEAMRTTGACPRCGDVRLLPGRDTSTEAPICGPCAGIGNLTCDGCGQEAEHYRRGRCARCCLTEDLRELLLPGRTDPARAAKTVHLLAAADRPESVLTWMRSGKVRDLLTRIGTAELPLTHAALDAEPAGRHVEHLRSILEHHGLLEARDHYLSLFERWLTDKLAPVTDPAIRQPVEQFGRWHHVSRIRKMNNVGTSRSRGPVHSSKQEVTETLKFLTWLHEAHAKHLPECNQQDVDEYLADGPTTRHLMRTFFVWADRAHVKQGIVIGHRTARTTRAITQDDRLAWIRTLLTGDHESLPYRVAGVLLLLYAQPLVRLSAVRVDAVISTPNGLAITFGTDPVPLPEPFAGLVREHLEARPNQRGANANSEWLFPGTRAGNHLHPNTFMDRLRALGVNLLGARNTALRQLVAQVPPPVVASMLGYSAQVAHLHTSSAAEPFNRYAARGVQAR